MIISEERVKQAVAEMNEGSVPQDTVVRAACRRIGAMVKTELSADELARYSDNIFYAAAIMALRDSLGADTSPSDIRVGDMSIKNPQRVEQLTEVLREVLNFLTPVLVCDGETFSAVEWRREPCRT